MASEWQQFQLGKVCLKIGSGATPRGGKEAYRGGETALIRSQNIYNDGFTREGLAYINASQAHDLRNVVVERNDVLLNITGDSVARCCQVDPEVLPARVNQHVAVIRTQPDVLDARFLRYVLVSPSMQDHLLALASAGATRNALTKAMIESLDIKAPIIDEQRAISHILGTLDDKIELNHKQNETLEAMASTLFKAWFVDFEPVRAKMEGRWKRGQSLPGLPEHLYDLFPDRLVDSELGAIPEGWVVKTIGDFVTIKRGGSPRPIQDFIRPAGIPWVKIADATSATSRFLFKTKEFIKEEGLKKTVLLKKGALILSNSATPGLPMFLELDACIHDGWLYFPKKHTLSDLYLYQLFLEIRDELVAQGNGSVFTNLKTDILRSQKIVVASEVLLLAFDNLAKPFFNKLLTINMESNSLVQLRDTLLPLLISGELRVPDVERIIGAAV